LRPVLRSNAVTSLLYIGPRPSKRVNSLSLSTPCRRWW
jgi:hypothetical protein